MYWPRQNELWVFLSFVWWMGSLIAWLGCFTGTWYPVASADAVTGTALFIALVSATLRLPTLTVTADTTPLEDHFVWLLSMGANCNWIGMLGMRSDSLWSILPAIAIASAVELWMLRRARSAGRLSWFLDWIQLGQSPVIDCSGRSDMKEGSLKSFAPAQVASEKVTSERVTGEHVTGEHVNEVHVGGQDSRVLRTMRDEISEKGNRHLSGEIFLHWQSGQKAIIVVIGFVPALRSPPQVDFDTECPDQLVRCLNCSETGLRFEVKRSPPLEASESMVAWSAIESPETAVHQDLQGNPERSPQLRKLA